MTAIKAAIVHARIQMNKVSDAIAEMKNIPTRQGLLDLLGDEIVDITFDKLSGDERTMKCTLMPSMLPPAQREDKLSQAKIRNLEDKVFVVWAIDIDPPAWRSFRYDRVKSVKIDFG
jgi:hypothetical protein